MLDNDISPRAAFIVTKTLAAKLSPTAEALGKPIFVEKDKPVPIIGIVERFAGTDDMRPVVQHFGREFLLTPTG